MGRPLADQLSEGEEIQCPNISLRDAGPLRNFLWQENVQHTDLSFRAEEDELAGSWERTVAYTTN